MTKFKRLLVLSMACILGFGIASCGEDPTPEVKPTPTPTEPTVQPTTPEVSTPEVSTPEVSTPEVSTPEVSTPEVSTPEVSTPEDSSTPAPSVNYAEEIKVLLDDTYKALTTRVESFELPAVQQTYDENDNPVLVNVVWTLTPAEGSLEGVVSISEVDPTTKKYTVTVNYNDSLNTEDVNFVLSCVITDPNGNEETLSYNYVVPQFKYATWQEVYAEAEKGAEAGTLTVKGTVIATYKDGVYFQTEDGNVLYAYGTASEGKGAQQAYFTNYPVGSKVLVSGTPALYYGNPQFNAGCSVTVYEQAPADYTVSYTDRTAAFAAVNSATSTDLFEYIYEPVSLNVTVAGKDTNQSYYFFTVGESTVEFYIRPSSSYCDFTWDAISAQFAEWTPGYKATIKGIVTTYNNKYYLSPIDVNSVEITERVTTPDSVADALFAEITFADTVTGNVPLHETEGLTWSVVAGATAAEVKDNKLVITQGAEAVNVTVKATFVYSGQTFEKEYSFVVAAYDLTCVELTDSALGLAAYAAGTATVNGVEFAYTELGSYGNGIQMRNKLSDSANPRKSELWNTTELAKPIKEIQLVYNTAKDTFDNANCINFSFGSDATVASYTTALSTVAGTKTYTITPDAETYTFFKLSYADDFTKSQYWDSIKIVYADGSTGGDVVEPETPVSGKVTFTVDSLGIASSTYAGGTTTVDGVAVEFIQIGNYGNGIQVRDKNGNTSKLWNTQATGAGITKIEFTYSSTQAVSYSNPDMMIVKFGNSTAVDAYQTT